MLHLALEAHAAKDLGHNQVLKSRMAGHSEVGAVELQDKAGVNNLLILLTHDVGDCSEVFLVRFVILVWLKGCDQTG